MKGRNAVRDMLTRCRNNEIEETKNKAAAQAASQRAQEEAKEKVFTKAVAHGKVIDTSFRCIQDIEDGTLQMEDSFTKMKHERMQGFAALQVCTRRIEIREKRSPEEKFHDHLSEALGCEKKVLEGLRSEIFNMEAEAKTLIDEMKDKRRFLSQDTGERRLEMAKDLSSLKPEVSAAPSKKGKAADSAQPAEGEAAEGAEAQTLVDQAKKAVDEAVGNNAKAKPTDKAAEKAAEKPAEKPAEGAKEGEGEGAAPAKEAEKVESKALIEATQKLLERTAMLRFKSFTLIDKSKLESKKALMRTEEAMQRRTIEMAVKEKTLKTQLLDVDAAITTGERALERLKKRIDPNDKARLERLQADEQALGVLRSSKTTLQEEIRNKMQALDMDNLCRRVTPAKADSAKAETAKRNMQRTASAPNMKGTRKDMGASIGNKSIVFGETADVQSSLDGSTRAPSSAKPPSPAGGSSTLRSAASAAGLQ